MVATSIIPLRNGLWRDGMRHIEATIRPLVGRDEVLIAELRPGATQAELITAVLANVTRCIGSVDAPTYEDVRTLTIGDRERLLLGLFRLSFGGRMEAVAQCSATQCGAAMELDLQVEDFLIPGLPHDLSPSQSSSATSRTLHTSQTTIDSPLLDLQQAWPEPVYEMAIASEEGGWQVRFRLPNGADQEYAARLAQSDLNAAADLILRRCSLEVTAADGSSIAPDKALPALRQALPEVFASLDPQAETTLLLHCPVCGVETRVLFDAGTFLLAALVRTNDIFCEVDRLARAYHWSEAEILALPVSRRRRYVGLASEAGVLT